MSGPTGIPAIDDVSRIIKMNEPKTDVGPFKFVAVGDLECKPPEYVIDGLIEIESLAQVFGDPACGKSFLAVDLAMSVASGTAFHGRSVKQGAVFYIAGEGHNGLIRRFAAWSKYHGVRRAGLPLYKSERAAQFLDKQSAASVAASVDAIAGQAGAPTLIIIDTLARNFGDGDENSTKDGQAFMTAMDDLREKFSGCTVLIVHHTGHQDKTRSRGSMTIKGSLDCEYRVIKDGDMITMRNVKMKDGEQPTDLYFKLTNVKLPDEVSSAVMVSGERPEKESTPLKGIEQVAMQALQDALRDHGETKTGNDWPSGVKVVQVHHWRDACGKHGLTTGASESAARVAFKRVKDKLMAMDEIREFSGYIWGVQGDA